VVGRGLGEHMPNDHDQGVRGGDSRLLPALFSEATVEPAELCANVGAGAPGGPGAFDENLGGWPRRYGCPVGRSCQ
jgi:hypothetical protein